MSLPSILMPLQRLFARRDRHGDALRRLQSQRAGLLDGDALEPATYTKLNQLIDQIATIKRHETAVLSEIEHVERQHRFLRQQKKLRHATSACMAQLDEPEPKPHRASTLPFWVLAMLFWLWSDRKKSPSNQEPRPN